MIGLQCLYLGIDAESASEDAEVSYVTSKAADNVSPFTSIIVIASGTQYVYIWGRKAMQLHRVT